MKRVKGLLRLDVIAGAAVIAAVAIAVPALGSDGDVTAADEPATSDQGLPAPPPPPMISAEDREQLDEAIQCMEDKGFGTPTPDAGDGEGPGVFIPREEADSDEFRQAAEDCDLPPPPTDAQIRAIGCADGAIRDERNDNGDGNG